MLLDTNVISELRKVRSGRAAPAIISWEATVSAQQLLLSVITLQEIEVGILRLKRADPRQASVLEHWLHNYLLVEFRDRLLPVTPAIAMRAAALLIDSNRSCEDALISATAYIHQMPVVTRNVAHFRNTGVHIINPWQL